eukprot:GHVP01042987.1.p1 GENE.GHVP01042987.1~~GHVP01042987.1.p1  ORF type:complete len:175 (+),score=23.63 GHVP01042987.1:118-642(+)
MMPTSPVIKNQILTDSAESTPNNPESLLHLKETLERAEIQLRLEAVALEQRKNMMSAFRFSNDNSTHLDESRIQIRALYPEHDEIELIPLYQKVAACLGSNDFQQARSIMLNPQRPYYQNLRKNNQNYRNSFNNQNNKNNYQQRKNQNYNNSQRSNSTPKKSNYKSDFQSGKQA